MKAFAILTLLCFITLFVHGQISKTIYIPDFWSLYSFQSNDSTLRTYYFDSNGKQINFTDSSFITDFQNCKIFLFPDKTVTLFMDAEKDTIHGLKFFEFSKIDSSLWETSELVIESDTTKNYKIRVLNESNAPNDTLLWHGKNDLQLNQLTISYNKIKKE